MGVSKKNRHMGYTCDKCKEKAQREAGEEVQKSKNFEVCLSNIWARSEGTI